MINRSFDRYRITGLLGGGIGEVSEFVICDLRIDMARREKQ